MTRTLTSTYTDVLDSTLYDGAVQGRGRKDSFRKNQSILLVAVYKSRLALLSLLLVINLLAIPMPAYSSTYSVDQLRLYVHSRVISFNEFICIDQILMQESHYNYLAVNGSHMGIGQMRSKNYQSKDPYTQIDLTIIYTHKRYKTMCKALAFHHKHGYY